MKEIIVKGIKTMPAKGRKEIKKHYSISGPKQRMVTSALKVVGALNALDKILKMVGGYARKVVFESILPQWLKDVIKGHKNIESFIVTSGDVKATIVPMKKYAVLNEERAEEILALQENYGVDLEISEEHVYTFNQDLIDQLSDDKVTSLIGELKAALTKSKVLSAKTKKDIQSGKITILKEETQYHYNEDVLSNLSKYSEGDVDTAMAIVDAVKPVFAFRSFELADKEVQVATALDLIKENLDQLPEAEKEEKD